LKGRVEKEQRTRIKEEIEIIKKPVKVKGESLQKRQEIKIESIARNHATQPGAGVNIVLDADGTIIATKIAKKLPKKLKSKLKWKLKRSLNKPPRRSPTKIFQNHFDPRPSNR